MPGFSYRRLSGHFGLVQLAVPFAGERAFLEVLRLVTMTMPHPAEKSPIRLAAIVPTLNEVGSIAALVGALRREVDEVWVVDANSEDGTAERAQAAGAAVVECPERSRGRQLDLGARAASAPGLVFVHADTGVPRGFGAAIRQALADPNVAGGNFRVRYVPPSASARIFTTLGELRQRALGLFYGDSCIFTRRDIYLGTSGLADHPLFEDYALARALARQGRLVLIETPVVTSSSRRFAGRALSTLALWAVLQAGYSLGVPPGTLAAWYRSAPRGRPHRDR